MKFSVVDRRLKGELHMSSAQGRRIYDHIVEHGLSRILELGFSHGKSTCYLAAAAEEVSPDARILTIDRDWALDFPPTIHVLLERCGLSERVTPIFSDSSYTWELMKLLDSDEIPVFDLVFIDGAHTWDTDGLAFFLVDRMLRPGGWIVFDDLDWTFAGSASMRERPWVRELPEELRRTPQIRRVFDVLVRRHPGYTSFLEEDGWGWAEKRHVSS